MKRMRSSETERIFENKQNSVINRIANKNKPTKIVGLFFVCF